MIHIPSTSRPLALIGTSTKAPAKIGGCPTSTCDSGCRTADLSTGTDEFTVDCAKCTDALYICLGNQDHLRGSS